MILEPEGRKESLVHYLVKAEVSKRVFDGLGKIFSLANSYFIISSLSIFSFGFYQLVLSFISILRGFSVKFFDGLVAIDMRRYFNVGKRDFAKRLFLENVVFKLGIGIIVTVAVFLGARLIADFYDKDIVSLIRWASILLIINAIQSLSSIFLDSIVSFAQRGLSALREFMKLGIVLSFLTWSELSITNVVIAHVVAEATSTLIFAIIVLVKIYPKVFGNIKARAENLMIKMVKTQGPRVALIFGLKEVLNDATPWLVRFFVGTEGVAFYSLAINMVNLAQDFIPMAALVPILALKADDLGGLSFIFKKVVKYTIWIGSLFLITSFLIVPPAIMLIFPKYYPAIPVFLAMAAVLPIYGAVKVIFKTLGALREYGIVAARLFPELAILFAGSAVFMPLFGITGIGLVYLARHIERFWFLYTRLVKKYPSFKIKIKDLFKFDRFDKDFAGRVFSHFLKFLKFGRGPA